MLKYHIFVVLNQFYEYMKINPGKNSKELISSEILKELNIGLWAIEIVPGKESRMFLDPLAAGLMGCSPDTDPEEIYKIWYSGIDKEAEVLIKSILDSMSSGRTSEVQYNWTHPDGSRRTIRCGGKRIASFTEGIRLEGTHREVGELDHLDDEWRQRSALLKNLRLINSIAVQYISLKVVRIDGRYSIIYKDMDPGYGWDKTQCGNFWRAFGELMQRHCHPEDLEKMIKFSIPEYVIALMKGHRRHLERFRYLLKDGRYIWMELVFVRFDESLDAELSEFAYGLANVDEEVNREKEYRQAMEQVRISREESRLKTQFVNNISHDIRTPLNAVIGYSQLLALSADQLGAKEREEYISYIESSGELLTMLIDDILCISDIEHDILQIRNEYISCRQICEKAVSCCRMRVPTDVKLYFCSEFDDNFKIYSDSKRIQQILINLISNSCKATVRGEIKLSCTPGAQEGFVDFAVSDTGCGVTPEKADEIFHRYVSMDNSNRGNGHGLGLDICIQLSRRMGGSIWLDKEYKGGARFVLTLPVENK